MHSPATVGSLEAALERAVSRFDDGSATSAQMRYHLGFTAGGRRGERLRSRLVLAVAEEEGGRLEDALDAACAVEIVHELSLVHDDIEVGDVRRYERDSVWSRFGLAHGINAGDALCAVAYLALLDGTSTRPPHVTVSMTRTLHEAHLALCGGHARNIAFKSRSRVSLAEYRAMIDGKTAALFGAACELGARSAGADAERAGAYARFGRAYGSAIHLEDDVFVTWGEAESGPPSRSARTGQPQWSFPLVWAAAGPPSQARDTIAAAYARPATGDEQDAVALVAALDALGARDASLREARAELDRADELARVFAIDRSERVRALFQQALRRVA
jgi:geranylgeranyl diphosphate synthase type I